MECNTKEWSKTSTGVGHHHRPGYYFPESTFQTLLQEPLPPELAKQDEITRGAHFKTTTGEAHDRKFPDHGPYGNTIHKKPPGHWKVNYIKDAAEKLQNPKYRRPLSPGHQKTEFQDEFRGETLPRPAEFEDQTGPFLVKDHAEVGPSQIGEGATMNPKAAGHTIFTKYPSVIKHLDPYVTTSQMDHRPFSKDEQQKARTDAASFWETEEYPRSKGFGAKHNPLPKDTVTREPLPMNDSMVFQHRTKIGPVLKASVPVVHSGLKTEVQENFQWPAHLNLKYMDNTTNPVDRPYLRPGPGPKAAYTAPRMYHTEYQNIGREKTITI